MAPTHTKAPPRRHLTASLEDYLEAVYELMADGGAARVRDIARRLDVGMPSVTAALKALAGRQLVNYEAYQLVTLTDLGRQRAAQISRRHHVLQQFLVEVIGVEPTDAEANACRMEHVLDRSVMDRLADFGEFVRRIPCSAGNWVEAFEQFHRDKKNPRRCRSCESASAGRGDSE